MYLVIEERGLKLSFSRKAYKMNEMAGEHSGCQSNRKFKVNWFLKD